MAVKKEAGQRQPQERQPGFAHDTRFGEAGMKGYQDFMGHEEAPWRYNIDEARKIMTDIERLRETFSKSNEPGLRLIWENSNRLDEMMERIYNDYVQNQRRKFNWSKWKNYRIPGYKQRDHENLEQMEDLSREIRRAWNSVKGTARIPKTSRDAMDEALRPKALPEKAQWILWADNNVREAFVRARDPNQRAKYMKLLQRASKPFASSEAQQGLEMSWSFSHIEDHPNPEMGRVLEENGIKLGKSASAEEVLDALHRAQDQMIQQASPIFGIENKLNGLSGHLEGIAADQIPVETYQRGKPVLQEGSPFGHFKWWSLLPHHKWEKARQDLHTDPEGAELNIINQLGRHVALVINRRKLNILRSAVAVAERNLSGEARLQTMRFASDVGTNRQTFGIEPTGVASTDAFAALGALLGPLGQAFRQPGRRRP